MGAYSEDPHKARSLPEGRRIDYMTAIAAVVYSDGVVHDTELAVLRALGEVLELGAESIDQIVAAARTPDHERVERILIGFRDGPLRYALLTDAFLVAFADKKLAPGESEELSEFAAALGISAAQAVLIARYVESALVDSEEHHLAKAFAEALADASSHVHPPRGVKWLYRKLTEGPRGP